MEIIDYDSQKAIAIRNSNAGEYLLRKEKERIDRISSIVEKSGRSIIVVLSIAFLIAVVSRCML